jgi:hypothetical protein
MTTLRADVRLNALGAGFTKRAGRIAAGDIREQAIEFRLDDRVALAYGLFQSGPVKDFNAAAAVADESGALQIPAASVTPSRRTPSMLAISSCVIVNESEERRSRLNNSQRHSCCSTE